MYCNLFWGCGGRGKTIHSVHSEFKPLEAPSLSTEDPWFLWLKYQILMCFEDCL